MKRKEEETPENVERWMLTYLDMITLLMAFFCILFAFSQVDAVKFKQVAKSMSLSFGTGGGGMGMNMMTNYSGTGIIPNLSGNSLVKLRENNQFKSMIKLIRDYAAAQGIKDMKAKITDRGLELNLPESILFESGKAELSSKSREILDRIAEILFKLNTVIRVEGHTDNVPIHNAKYASNWQLSTDRATNVIMYWISKYPNQSANLSAAGYGEHHPIASNATEEGRAKNRRVEIIVLRQTEAKKERNN